MKKLQGFTLIELMVTLSVLAIIATMAAPSFGNMLEKQNLNKSSQDLIATIKDARAKAVIERRNDVVVKLNSDAANTEKQLNWQPSGKAVLVSTLTELKFNFDGTIKDAPVSAGEKTGISFKICNKTGGDFAKVISVSPMGTIQHIVEESCS